MRHTGLPFFTDSAVTSAPCVPYSTRERASVSSPEKCSFIGCSHTFLAPRVSNPAARRRRYWG